MTNEQAAPQSEDQVFPRMLSHVVNEIANLRLKLIQPHLTVSLREHYEAKVMELEQLIRILEAWPEIKRTLRMYSLESNWALTDEYDNMVANVFHGDDKPYGQGFEPAQRALALVKGNV